MTAGATGGRPTGYRRSSSARGRSGSHPRCPRGGPGIEARRRRKSPDARGRDRALKTKPVALGIARRPRSATPARSGSRGGGGIARAGAGARRTDEFGRSSRGRCSTCTGGILKSHRRSCRAIGPTPTRPRRRGRRRRRHVIRMMKELPGRSGSPEMAPAGRTRPGARGAGRARGGRAPTRARRRGWLPGRGDSPDDGGDGRGRFAWVSAGHRRDGGGLSAVRRRSLAGLVPRDAAGPRSRDGGPSLPTGRFQGRARPERGPPFAEDVDDRSCSTGP